MDAKAIQQLITQIVFLLGGWTVIVIAVTAWISQVATKRLFNEWDKRNQIEIDRIRHTQQQSDIILKELISIASSNQSNIQSLRTEAIDKLWIAIIALRENFSIPIMYFDITYPAEYSQLHTNPKISSSFGVTNIQAFEWIKSSLELEKYRPYLGEVLWQQFYFYRSILGRMAVLITQLMKGEKLDDWKEDSFRY